MSARYSFPGRLISWVCALQLLTGAGALASVEAAPVEGKFSNEQLDSLVAPIALYPDPLLAQTLAASTYPLELVQLRQWLERHRDLKDKALVEAVEKENWDPSVQSMAPLADVVKRLTEDIKWTTDLGNAFLAQQSGVMDAVQRMRTKAEEKGALKSSKEMKVEDKPVDGKSVIVIEQADPNVVYVPSYNPTVVYGPPVYAYPPVYYPPPSYYAGGMFMSFTFGVAMGAAFSGGWGYNCGWGGNNNINVNRNNTFVRTSDARAARTGGRTTSGGTWQHNPQHRGGTPYSNSATANRYGGTTRGAPESQRQANARQQQRSAGTTQRAGTASGPSGARTNPNQIGSRTTSTGPRSGGTGGEAFGGGSQGYSGSSARASSSRGGSSMRSGGGGGGRR